MSRPQRYGRDSHFVTDGTVNAVKRIVCIVLYALINGVYNVHDTCPCYRLGLSMFIHVHDKIHSRKYT